MNSSNESNNEISSNSFSSGNLLRLIRSNSLDPFSYFRLMDGAINETSTGTIETNEVENEVENKPSKQSAYDTFLIVLNVFCFVFIVVVLMYFVCRS